VTDWYYISKILNVVLVASVIVLLAYVYYLTTSIKAIMNNREDANVNLVGDYNDRRIPSASSRQSSNFSGCNYSVDEIQPQTPQQPQQNQQPQPQQNQNTHPMIELQETNTAK
jgi:Tfp pilus assembly protein PilO